MLYQTTVWGWKVVLFLEIGYNLLLAIREWGNGKSKIFQRNFLGSKGIGRLAAMALGRYLTVITKTAEEITYNWLTIDRQDFKVETLLSNIEFPGGKFPIDKTNIF